MLRDILHIDWDDGSGHLHGVLLQWKQNEAVGLIKMSQKFSKRNESFSKAFSVYI